jgi:phosphohistidine phosphatase
MKTIIFLRHGKAEEKWPKIDDWTRLLTEKWIAITKMNVEDKKDKILPVDCILSSKSLRCKMTADVAAKVLWYDRNAIVYDARLRTADYMTILDCITSLSEDWNTVMIVWQNDQLSEAANTLTQQNIGSIPKSGLICQTFTCSLWTWVNQNSRQMQWKHFGE